MSDERIIYKARDLYNLDFNSARKLTSKTFKINCENDRCFIVKNTELYAAEKYSFLKNQGLDNVIYPIKNKNNQYISQINDDLFYITEYYDSDLAIPEVNVKKMNDELQTLHFNTYFKKQLSSKISRRKMEDIYDYLQYKFNVIEVYVRTLETRPFDEYSIPILKNYHYILDCRKVMADKQKKLISDIKEKKSVNYSFVHNNPKLDHLISNNGRNYLISFEHSKIGIPALDLVKLYLETDDLDYDKYELITNYFNHYNDNFYFDYFCFFVLLYYIKGIVIIDKDYVSSQSFLFASTKIKHFLVRFNLVKDEKNK